MKARNPMKVESLAQLPIVVSKDHADYYGCGWSIYVERKGNKLSLHGERYENDKDVLLSKDECLDIVRSQEFVLLTAKGVKSLLEILERNDDIEEFEYPAGGTDDKLFELLDFRSRFSNEAAIIKRRKGEISK
ncbi:hypothetical protein B7C51_04985 [Paenibacillus larvae subsp. pulvifaciens]|uniref:Uncharacterized protein n=2 Tax=Paenibacillus larvae TaxID=1464 RepID=A0A1V0UPV6_9BACL|nr:hypothetical protein B7C51_04985 [Paenibacillus larvae subsp. pulvifaciens]